MIVCRVTKSSVDVHVAHRRADGNNVKGHRDNIHPRLFDFQRPLILTTVKISCTKFMSQKRTVVAFSSRFSYAAFPPGAEQADLLSARNVSTAKRAAPWVLARIDIFGVIRHVLIHRGGKTQAKVGINVHFGNAHERWLL